MLSLIGAQRSHTTNAMLSDLERRLQELKMQKISAENEVQMIQVDGAGQLHDTELSAVVK